MLVHILTTLINGNNRVVEKSSILLQIEKQRKSSDGDLTCYMYNLDDAVAHVAISNCKGVLLIEK